MKPAAGLHESRPEAVLSACAPATRRRDWRASPFVLRGMRVCRGELTTVLKAESANTQQMSRGSSDSQRDTVNTNKIPRSSAYRVGSTRFVSVPDSRALPAARPAHRRPYSIPDSVSEKLRRHCEVCDCGQQPWLRNQRRVAGHSGVCCGAVAGQHGMGPLVRARGRLVLYLERQAVFRPIGRIAKSMRCDLTITVPFWTRSDRIKNRQWDKM